MKLANFIFVILLVEVDTAERWRDEAFRPLHRRCVEDGKYVTGVGYFVGYCRNGRVVFDHCSSKDNVKVYPGRFVKQRNGQYILCYTIGHMAYVKFFGTAKEVIDMQRKVKRFMKPVAAAVPRAFSGYWSLLRLLVCFLWMLIFT
ncbi:hypothetical protein AB6A40_009318 [Gnathostoma spinigerum]|uniref:Uncharacterized protein n=1 Tax=Gnathostoma spinigerum TaxID=75299 RepID=A0ABD6EZA8_9BILA